MTSTAHFGITYQGTPTSPNDRRVLAWYARFGDHTHSDTGKVHGPTANPNNIDCGCGWGHLCDAERGYFTGRPYTLCGATPFPCTGTQRNRASDRMRPDDWGEIVDTTC